MSKTRCPVCGGKWFDPLYSMNKMYCFKCEAFRPFFLKEGQKSLLIKGLVGNKEDNKDKNRRDKW